MNKAIGGSDARSRVAQATVCASRLAHSLTSGLLSIFLTRIYSFPASETGYTPDSGELMFNFNCEKQETM